jgi:hypothetical protein
MTTLTRERRQRFEAIILSSELYAMAEEDQFAGKEERINAVKVLAYALADAAASRTELKTDETPEDYNVEVFRGDFREYPEHLWEVARVLRDTWMFRLPPKPKKKSEKGQYGMYCLMMDNVKQACGEFGADVLVKVHADWKAGYKGAIAPYTVAQPSSLVNPCSGKARELRDKAVVEINQPKPKETEQWKTELNLQ